MSSFTRSKVSFALALLGSLFVLHPIVQRFENVVIEYLGFRVRLLDAYAALAGLLAVAVYFYAMALTREQSNTWAERAGNYFYSLSLMVVPLLAGLCAVNRLATALGHSHVAWAAPIVAVVLGIVWVLVSNVAAWRFKGRVAEDDRRDRIEQLAEREIISLTRAQDLMAQEHYDLSVIEAWKSLEARLRRALIVRKNAGSREPTAQVIARAIREGILREPAHGQLEAVQRHRRVAISHIPLTREAAAESLAAVRHILATIPLETGRVESTQPPSVPVPPKPEPVSDNHLSRVA